MIEPPVVTTRAATDVAAIPLVIPRAEMGQQFGAAIVEIMATLAAQGIAAAGPVVAHHLRMSADTFDFEVAVPVATPVAPAGRVVPRAWPERTVAATIHHGGYADLHAAWGELMAWLAGAGHRGAPDLFEIYLSDPAVPPAETRTRLERPLA